MLEKLLKMSWQAYDQALNLMGLFIFGNYSGAISNGQVIEVLAINLHWIEKFSDDPEMEALKEMFETYQKRFEEIFWDNEGVLLFEAKAIYRNFSDDDPSKINVKKVAEYYKKIASSSDWEDLAV